MTIKITKFNTMSDYSPLTSLIKLRSLLLLKEVELGWQTLLVYLVGLGLREYFDSFGADEPWVLLGPKIFFNHLGDVKSFVLSFKNSSSYEVLDELNRGDCLKMLPKISEDWVSQLLDSSWNSWHRRQWLDSNDTIECSSKQSKVIESK